MFSRRLTRTRRTRQPRRRARCTGRRQNRVQRTNVTRQTRRQMSILSDEKAALPDLPYSYSALEPTISGEIMELHHSKHHQAYVTNYTNALAAYQDGDRAAATVSAINFNFGGHVNHGIFWQNLAPKSEGGGAPPTGDLAAHIQKNWGSLEQFQTTFSAKTAAVQGSGWGWLVLNKTSNDLEIITLPNQDVVSGDHVPLLGIDVWEHAYYLQYKNVRPDYLKAIWEVVNWQDVGSRYTDATGN